MTHNAAKITGTLESAMEHLRAAESNFIRARMLMEQDSTPSVAAMNRVRDIEGTVSVAKRTLTPEISHWEAEIDDH